MSKSRVFRRLITPFAALAWLAACACPALAAGDELFQAKCLGCHGAKLSCAKLGQASAQDWREIVAKMIAQGAKLTPEQSSELEAFLTALPPGSEPVCEK